MRTLTVLLYDIFIRSYVLGIHLASIFNTKAKLWVQGRKDLFKKLTVALDQNEQPVVWMHCASLGEFEQGRPILEKIKQEYPDHKILLTFFSPSGYEIRKNYGAADWVFYLPPDTKANAVKFIEIVKPGLAVFVKYEYWYHYLDQLHHRQIPGILISAIFRKGAIFFKWYGGLHRKMLGFFAKIFVQNEDSLKITEIVPGEQCMLAGDTRFDRVAAIASGFQPIAAIEKFVSDTPVIVAGSTWPEDEQNLKKLIEKSKFALSLIIAPHEINDDHIQFLRRLFPGSLLYSQLEKSLKDHQPLPKVKVLIIDNIGMLSRLYHYGAMCYIGGGFNKSGIHNILEAAVYGRPVVFGPNYQKFYEANMLIKSGGSFSYSNDNDLIRIVGELLSNQQTMEQVSGNSKNFVIENTGATEKILAWLRKTSF